MKNFIIFFLILTPIVAFSRNESVSVYINSEVEQETYAKCVQRLYSGLYLQSMTEAHKEYSLKKIKGYCLVLTRRYMEKFK